MDLITTTKVLTRHWLLSALALLAAIAVTAIVYVVVPTTFSGNAIVLLQVPRTGSAYHPQAGNVRPSPAIGVNPYLSVDSSLWVLSKVIVQDLTGDASKAQLQSDGQKLNYEVTAQSDVPAIGIAVMDSNRSRIVAKLNEIIALATTDLTDRQRATGVPEDTWVTATISNVPLKMDKTKDKLKMIIAVAVVALGAAISLVFITESLQVGSRRRERTRLVEKLRELDRDTGIKQIG